MNNLFSQFNEIDCQQTDQYTDRRINKTQQFNIEQTDRQVEDNTNNAGEKNGERKVP